MQHAVGQQIIKLRIGALNNHRGQAGNRAGGALDDVAHQLLEAVGDAVQLVAHGGADIEIAAHHIGVPANPHAERRGTAANGWRHHGLAAANLIVKQVVDRASRAEAVVIGGRANPGEKQ